MSNGLGRPQGGFRAPRVPLDLRCVILAVFGYLAVLGVDWVLARLMGVTSPVAQMVSLVAEQLGHIAFLGTAFRSAMAVIWGLADYELAWWQAAITAFCFFAVWSIFGAALLRTAALRLSRDEPLSLRDALRFSTRNIVAFLLAPVLVLLFAAFFAGCNALAGLVLSIPLIGSSVLALILFPLVLISSLLIILALMGGVVGLPLMWAGIAVEQNGALEALSRAFSYIFARPFRFFFSYFLLFVLMSILMLAGGFFETTVKTTLQVGVVRDALDDAIRKEPRPVDVLQDEFLDSERVTREAEGIRNIRNLQNASWWDWLGVFWMWLLLNIFLLGFKGYALYFFLGGTTSLYLQLRYEVDGTEEEEIYPESEEELAALAGEEPKWVGEGPEGETTEAPEPAAEEGPPEE
ncbi:MAG: hypothetical protein ACYTEZ_07890 [Planctomycetota bacterium]|jgi:hypothetical protein